MIWVWINAVVRFLIDLVTPPPAPIIPINPNEVCPGCGNCEGQLTAVEDVQHNVRIQHRCKICNLKWWVRTVYAGPQAATSATAVIKADPPTPIDTKVKRG